MQLNYSVFSFFPFFSLSSWRDTGGIKVEMHGRGWEEEGERERGTNEVNPRSRGWRIVATGCAVLAAYCVVYLQRPRAMANVVLVNEKLSYGVSKPSSPYQLCLLHKYEIEPAASLAALGTGTRVIWL